MHVADFPFLRDQIDVVNSCYSCIISGVGSILWTHKTEEIQAEYGKGGHVLAFSKFSVCFFLGMQFKKKKKEKKWPIVLESWPGVHSFGVYR